MTQIASNLKKVCDTIAETALSCGRTPSEVRLLAVCKTFPPEAVEVAARHGQRLFGENRVQEAESKAAVVKAKNLEWHLIGHLQSNKVRRAVRVFDVIQTIDSEKLARIVNLQAGENGKRLPVLLEVNVGDESQKAGITPDELPRLVEVTEDLQNLELRGLMAIPPFAEDPEASRPYFRRLAQLLREVSRSVGRPLTELSMGMSHDFTVAIEEGATLVRVGTAIFGARPV